MDTLAIWTVIIIWCLHGGLVAEQALAKGWRWYAFMLAGPFTLVIDSSYRRGRWHCRAHVEQHGLKPAWCALRELQEMAPRRSVSYQRGIKDELLTQLSEQRRGPAKAARQWWKGAKQVSSLVADVPEDERAITVSEIMHEADNFIAAGIGPSDNVDYGFEDGLTILRKAYRL